MSGHRAVRGSWVVRWVEPQAWHQEGLISDLAIETSLLDDPGQVSFIICQIEMRRTPTSQGEEAAGCDRLIHERDLAWLQQADVVVAEVTQPSLGVGYELGRAVALNKRILCLFRPQSGRVLSAMIRGAADGTRFQVWDYEENEVETLLDRYFETDPPEPGAASPSSTLTS
uniref:2'-deoxynucleoside 5'-phosphate N-hydrolase 1 n=1 Tax=Monodelphis domestica TaxID=13616 RepID=A0A5F8G314_MONDO